MKVFGRAIVRRRRAARVASESEAEILRGAIPVGYDGRVAGSGLTSLPVVFGCVSRAVNRIAGMPIQSINAERDIVPLPRWVYNPNEWLGWTGFVSTLVIGLWLSGNVIVLPVRDEDGMITELVMPNPKGCSARRTEGGGVEYRIGGRLYTGEVFHQRYVTLPNEPWGLGCIQAAKKATELGLRSQNFSADFFANHALIKTVFTTDQELDEDQAKLLLAQIRQHHVGEGNAFKPLVASSGLTPHTIAQSMEQSEFMELSRWSAAQISAMIFGIDPTLMGVAQPGSQLTYSNTPARERQLWLDALHPLIVRIEELLSALLGPGVRFDIVERDLLLGGLSDRATVARNMALINKDMGGGVILPSEIRDVLGLDFIPGLDEALAGTLSSQTQNGVTV